MSTTISQHSDIYQRILAHTEPCPPFAPPWDFIPPGPSGAFTTVRDPAAVFARLCGSYSVAQLVAAGVVRSQHGQPPSLVSGLADPTGLIVPIRAAPDAPPVGLLGQGCCAPAGTPAYERMLGDYVTRKYLQSQPRMIILTPDIIEVALLRAIGLPAATICGLGAMSPYHKANILLNRAEPRSDQTSAILQREDRFGGQDLEVAIDDSTRPTVVFLLREFRLFEGYGQQASLKTAEFLCELEDHFGFDLACFRGWGRGDSDARLEFVTKQRDVDLLQQYFVESFGESRGLRVAVNGERMTGYLPTRNKLLEELKGSDEPTNHSIEQARSDYYKAIHDELAYPVVTEALADFDPNKKIAGVKLGSVIEILLRMEPDLLDLQRREAQEIRRVTCRPGNIEESLIAQLAARKLKQYLDLMQSARHAIRMFLHQPVKEPCKR